MRFTTIVFDLDHTLLDSDTSEALAFAETLGTIGVDQPSQHLETYQRINVALWKRVENGELSPNEVKNLRFIQLLDKLNIVADPEELGAQYLRSLGNHGELYDDARSVLTALSDWRIGLVTNGIGSVQRRRLERLDLAHFFAGVAISGEVGVAKPDPAIFDHLGFTPWSPQDSVIVGDSLTSDIAAGANAGMSTCWYNPSGKPVVGPITPTLVVRTLAELPEVLATG